MWRFALPLIGFVILVAIFAKGLELDPQALPSPLTEKQAPAFDLEDLQRPDGRVSSEMLGGKPMLVNVWATWCPPCRAEHDFLLELQREGVQIVGFNWQDDRAAALEWLRVLGDPYVATGFDPQGRAGIDWGVISAPETFLIDADRVIRHKHFGELTREIWERDFVPLWEVSK